MEIRFTLLRGRQKEEHDFVMGLDIPLVERETVVIDPDGDPGVGGVTISNITLYYHPDVTELQVR